MKFTKRSVHYLIITIMILFCSSVHSKSLTNEFNSTSAYQVCFTPGNNCTKLIVDLIDHAKNSIYLQAYSFTSSPIAKAIVDAKKRNIDVRVILDKSQQTQKYSSSKYLTNSNVPVWIDYKPAIAHNKIIIIDNAIVITGSFNFTKAAQFKNAENLLVIQDSNLAKIYLGNFNSRLSQSNKIY